MYSFLTRASLIWAVLLLLVHVYSGGGVISTLAGGMISVLALMLRGRSLVWVPWQFAPYGVQQAAGTNWARD